MNIALIFAGGIGKRMGNAGTPKQFLKLYNKEIIVYTLEVFQNSEDIDGIVISCLPEKINFLEKLVQKYELTKVKSIVPGGNSGQESIYHGLEEIEKLYSAEDIVLIHDGVRPLITGETIEDNIAKVKEEGNSITTVQAIETIITSEKDKREIHNILDRSQCHLARAPQSFYLKDILGAHRKAIAENKLDFIDSASMMSYYGTRLHMVNGPVENIKITTPGDYYIFKAMIDMKESINILGL